MSSKRAGTRRWLKEHLSDPYVREANAKGYRSRAAIKLKQLDDAEHLIHRGDAIIDLGAAPGGWSQLAAQRVGAKGKVVAVDLLQMEPIAQVHFLQGDFTDTSIQAQIREFIGSARVRLVMSDMAPNLTGVKDSDQARAEELAMQALAFGTQILAPEGKIVLKIFHGGAMEDVIREARRLYRKVKIKKPQASRARSAEVYLLGMGVDLVL